MLLLRREVKQKVSVLCLTGQGCQIWETCLCEEREGKAIFQLGRAAWWEIGKVPTVIVWGLSLVEHQSNKPFVSQLHKPEVLKLSGSTRVIALVAGETGILPDIWGHAGPSGWAHRPLCRPPRIFKMLQVAITFTMFSEAFLVYSQWNELQITGPRDVLGVVWKVVGYVWGGLVLGDTLMFGW